VNVFSLYRDFFAFLKRTKRHSPKWPGYLRWYCEPHREFFDAYFSNFPSLDRDSLRERVERIRNGDYSRLESLVAVSPPEVIIRRAYRKCRKLAAPREEPDVYLLVGFFSPDAFVLTLRGKPVICFGLERFKDFSLMAILFAHEYAHFLTGWARGKVRTAWEWKWRLMAEGLATAFSSLVFPERPLSDHFLVRRDVLNWYQANEDRLRQIYNPERYAPDELLEIFVRGKPECDIPARAGKYLGFLAVKKYISGCPKTVEELLADKGRILSLEI
jgi:hypothetical protein